MKKALQIIGILLVIAVIIFLIVFFRNYYLIKSGQLIEWKGEWYTMDEIREKYPPQVYEVESKNDPEEVYSQFRQALLDNDLEKALSFIREKNQDAYREALKSQGDLSVLAEKYPKKINKSHEYGNFSSYDFEYIDNGKKIFSSIEFIKNEEGYWEIDHI